MKLDIKPLGEKLMVGIEGTVDQIGAEELKTAFDRQDLSRIKEVRIDLGKVSYIGSAGVGKFLLLYKNLPSAEAVISIVNVPEEIYQTLMLMELDEIFTIRR